MDIRKLAKEEVETIYNTFMVNDFPADELKPLDRIIISMDNGIYECLGYFDGDELTSYALFVILDKNYLLDYFAVLDGKRNEGLGSAFLKELSGDYLKGNKSFIIEVENPEFAESQDERNLMERRIGFYYRNGFKNTGIKAKLWSANFLIMVPQNSDYATEDIRKNYISFYKNTLPPEMFRNNVFI